MPPNEMEEGLGKISRGTPEPILSALQNEIFFFAGLQIFHHAGSSISLTIAEMAVLAVLAVLAGIVISRICTRSF